MIITKVVPGLLIATPDQESFVESAVQRIGKAMRDALMKNDRIAIALSGGETPRPVYRALSSEVLAWSRVDIHIVDERAVPKDDKRSNYGMIREELLEPTKVTSVFPLEAWKPNLEEAAKEAEATIRKKVRTGPGNVPIFDVVVLGIGDDGHTASLFPNEPTVHDEARLVLAVPAKAAREARLSLARTVLENADNIIVLATGAKKQGAIERVWEVTGDLSATPARILRNARGGITWVIDRAAGGLG